VYLLVKLRISPPGATAEKKELNVEETKRLAQATAKEDEQFLSTREDAEDLDTSSTNGFAHAPYWPGVSSSDTFLIYSHFLSIIFRRHANLRGGSR
jgi:translocation protein SEC63